MRSSVMGMTELGSPKFGAILKPWLKPSLVGIYRRILVPGFLIGAAKSVSYFGVRIAMAPWFFHERIEVNVSGQPCAKFGIHGLLDELRNRRVRKGFTPSKRNSVGKGVSKRNGGNSFLFFSSSFFMVLPISVIARNPPFKVTK